MCHEDDDPGRHHEHVGRSAHVDQDARAAPRPCRCNGGARHGRSVTRDVRLRIEEPTLVDLTFDQIEERFGEDLLERRLREEIPYAKDQAVRAQDRHAARRRAARDRRAALIDASRFAGVRSLHSVEGENRLESGVEHSQLGVAQAAGGVPERASGSTTVSCSTITRVWTPWISISGRNDAGRRPFEVGAIRQVDSGRSPD